MELRKHFISIFFGIFLLIESAVGVFNFKPHLKVFEDYRYPLGDHKENHIRAKNHIEATFREHRLVVHLKQFNTKIATPLNNAVVEVTGTNIIGISEAIKENSPFLIVSANYDSSLQWNPLMENGATMASLLILVEKFQKLKEAALIEQKTAIVFVAFDIDIKAHVPVGPGDSGAKVFVEQQLPELFNTREFLGVVVLDSISNFNLEKQSQVLLKGFSENVPDVYESIHNNQEKGDFLALVTRSNQRNLNFSQEFEKIYNHETENKPYHLEHLVIKDGDVVTRFLVSLKKSHLPFWSNGLPAFLLTDLGITRKPADGDECKKLCSAETFLNEHRQHFLGDITNALIRMIVHHQIVVQTPEHPSDIEYEYEYDVIENSLSHIITTSAPMTTMNTTTSAATSLTGYSAFYFSIVLNTVIYRLFN